MLIFGLELFTVCHHPGKVCDNWHFDRGGLTFLICHVTSSYQTFNGLYEFMGGSRYNQSLTGHFADHRH